MPFIKDASKICSLTLLLNAALNLTSATREVDIILLPTQREPVMPRKALMPLDDAEPLMRRGKKLWECL